MKFTDYRTTVLLLTQRDIAEIVGVSEATIYSIERGNKPSKLTRGKMIRALSEYLGQKFDPNDIDELKID